MDREVFRMIQSKTHTTYFLDKTPHAAHSGSSTGAGTSDGAFNTALFSGLNEKLWAVQVEVKYEVRQVFSPFGSGQSWQLGTGEEGGVLLGKKRFRV